MPISRRQWSLEFQKAAMAGRPPQSRQGGAAGGSMRMRTACAASFGQGKCSKSGFKDLAST